MDKKIEGEEMRILLAHNEYGKYSGEEAVVDKMDALFRSLGHEVRRLRMTSAGARDTLKGKVSAFVSGIYSPAGVKAMKEAIAEFKPDVVNVHNLYPFISPAALRKCKKAGVPVVMTVHNFRLICPTGLFMRNGGPCEYCLEKGNEWGCLRFNCEHSLLKSTAYAARNAAARWRRDYLDCVDRYACITQFQCRKLEQAGFPADKLVHIPNSIVVSAESVSTPSESEPEVEAGQEMPGGYAGFCGRISKEKGIDLIIEAARSNPDIPVRLAGEVADPTLVADLPPNVTLTGYLSGKSLEEFYRGVRFIVMASRCYEGFPMAILEAAKYGKPTIAPDHGGFTEIIGRGEDAVGMLFTPGDAESLSKAMADLWHTPGLAASRGRAAKKKLQMKYSTDVVAAQWEELLQQLKN